MTKQLSLPNMFDAHALDSVDVATLTVEDKQAVYSLAERLAKRDLDAPALCHPDTVSAYLRMQYMGRPAEVFGVIFLTNQNNVIAVQEVSHGTINSAAVYPRTIVQETLRHNAAAVILFHNHPSGYNKPSEADKAITQRIKNALDLIDVGVLDHFIVAKEGAYSFANHGLM